MRGIDLAGKKFGRLNVLEYTGADARGNSMFLCECDCGNKKIVRGNYLRNGMTKSCGCYREDVIKTHGLSDNPLYKVWANMNERCTNASLNNYKRYGGRGIKVCEEWSADVSKFIEWSMENGYRNGLSIDRIDNDKDYEPSNCKWSTRKEQARNTSTNVFIDFGGKNMTIAEWSEKLGIKYDVLYKRYKLGDRGYRLLKPMGR